MSGEIADYQMSALTMAICLKGMNSEETAYLTEAMLNSGDVVDLSRFSTLSVDKHSTGGVGDKTTLIIAPIVAACGCKVAKMSGRGLGFTGGTVDKLESIDGYNATLSPDKFLKQVEDIGICVVGQSGNLAPADKKLYALRDVTATVDSIPLIASSIMSKKLASGSFSIVLDVKCGSGAFMKDEQSAVLLANAMIDIGKSFGRRVRALVTNMDVPLGIAVGNRLEVWEAIQVLSGKGEEKLSNLCISLASNMVSLALEMDIEDATETVKEAISSRSALEKMKEWIAFQGGDVSFINEPNKLLNATRKREYLATENGYISKINAEGVGKASMLLGAGRSKIGDEIDFTSGIILHKSLGSLVKKGDVVATMYTSSRDFCHCENELNQAIEYSSIKPCEQQLIYKII